MEHPNIPADKKQFHCEHCNGVILVPRDLPPTTAPCPYCGGMITSPAGDGNAPAGPPAVPMASEAPAPAAPQGPPPVPPPAEIDAMIHGGKPVEPAPPPVSSAPPQQPSPVVPPAPPVAAAPTAPAVTQEAAPKPETTAPAPARKDSSPGKSKPQPKTGRFPVMLVLLLLLAGGALTYFVTREMTNREIKAAPKPQTSTSSGMDAAYIRRGWQKDAARLLHDFLAADTCEKKMPYVLNSETVGPKMKEFYGDSAIDDSDTPAGSFAVYELSEEDRSRGLFMMTYDQPPQFDMREFFRPLATLEVQYGIDEADLLLSTLARAGNFAMEPLRVHAFFKHTSQGLKLDWEIFAQTKYRTFRNFVEMPEAGHTGVFRVFIVEDVPDSGQAAAGNRTYRLSDPAHMEDTARVNVRADSEIGRTLSVINWRGTKEGQPLTRTATVELEWSQGTKPTELRLRRFICWEFLGLGGSDNPAPAAAK